jgi:hypothetical protein
MYRIVKRIVHTITTVTWLIRLEDDRGKAIEKEITFPASHAVTEEEVTNTKNISTIMDQSFKPTLDEGENHE